jgi:hypothetical protein
MSASGGPGHPVSDDTLREALAAVAHEVKVEPASYREVSAGWRRRYRRRRITLAILATVVFGLADAVGLWALNTADPTPGVIFSDPQPPTHARWP